MSREVCVSCEIRSMLIMKDTLTQMGIDFNEVNKDEISIRRNYHNILINAANGVGQITFDEMDLHQVNGIRQNYMTNFFKDQAIREGNQIQEERNTQGQVILHVLRG